MACLVCARALTGAQHLISESPVDSAADASPRVRSQLHACLVPPPGLREDGETIASYLIFLRDRAENYVRKRAVSASASAAAVCFAPCCVCRFRLFRARLCALRRLTRSLACDGWAGLACVLCRRGIRRLRIRPLRPPATLAIHPVAALEEACRSAAIQMRALSTAAVVDRISTDGCACSAHSLPLLLLALSPALPANADALTV